MRINKSYQRLRGEDVITTPKTKKSKRGSNEAGVKRIRIHDLRHSHVSLLIEMGFSVVAIANRVGHESIDITYRYAHMLPTAQNEMAAKLNVERGIEDVS